MKTVILHSGGLDSTTCLLLALERGDEVVSVGVDYQQRNRAELLFAEKQCERYGVKRKLIELSWDKPIREIPEDRTIDEMKTSVSPAFLPGRNAIFLVVACAEAAGLGAKEVWIGVNSLDYSGYPDCRPEFIESFKTMIDLAIPNGSKIVAPLQNMSKPEIAKEAHRLGIRPGDTWSCYQPIMTDSGPKVCGKCDACILHQHAWNSIGEI